MCIYQEGRCEIVFDILEYFWKIRIYIYMYMFM